MHKSGLDSSIPPSMESFHPVCLYRSVATLPRTRPGPLALPLRRGVSACSPLLLFLLVLVVPRRSSGFLVLTLVLLAKGLGFEFVPVALEILEPEVEGMLESFI